MRPLAPEPAPALRRLADGTVKQVNPFTGTQVWAVPGRGNRPLEHTPERVVDVDPDAPEAHCAFCATRLTQTTPEKSRSVRREPPERGWRTLEAVAPEELDATVADVRVVGNLFEIVPTDYWSAVHGQPISERARAHRAAYLSSAAGREHVRALLRTKLGAAGADPSPVAGWDDAELAAHSAGFFGGSHDVVVARRHLVDGATRSDLHASSGTLTPAEHAEFCAVAARTARRLYEDNPCARHVAVFQNWLRPAGASFDHLHKQVVAIDEPPAQAVYEHRAQAADPELYARFGVGLAWEHDLVVARTEHAVAVVGVGHRFPSLVVWSTAPAGAPWEHSPEQLRGVSDLLHACHAATGPLVPCNEEWHHRQRGLDAPAPWRIVLKWRVSTPAGFEGATGVFVTTIDPWALRDRVVPRLRELRAAGAIAPLLIGDECGPIAPELRFREGG